jgi:hypothetical protein
VNRPGAFVVTLGVLVLAACTGETETADTTPAASAMDAAPARSVQVVTPADGDTVQGPNITVRLLADGFTVVAAGDTTPNSGHHHVFLDRDVTPPDLPIPAEPGFIIHVGTGATEVTIEGVAAGEHRLIAVVGDAAHVPLQPWVVDTVRFVVR